MPESNAQCLPLEHMPESSLPIDQRSVAQETSFGPLDMTYTQEATNETHRLREVSTLNTENQQKWAGYSFGAAAVKDPSIIQHETASLTVNEAQPGSQILECEFCTKRRAFYRSIPNSSQKVLICWCDVSQHTLL